MKMEGGYVCPCEGGDSERQRERERERESKRERSAKGESEHVNTPDCICDIIHSKTNGSGKQYRLYTIYIVVPHIHTHVNIHTYTKLHVG